MICSLALLVLGLALQLATPALAEEAALTANKTILFVCLHGSVKSQMAAAYFNQIARERGLPFTAVSRGVEVESSIPAPIRDGLSRDGLAPLDDVPRPLTPAEATSAVKIFAFDAVPDEKRGAVKVNYWTDVPPATKNYAEARDVILRHIDELVPALSERPRHQETVQGTVTGVDERNDRITLRLASDSSDDFRVQDPLVFNAVHDGDRVKITVEDINGRRTIVELKKE